MSSVLIALFFLIHLIVVYLIYRVLRLRLSDDQRGVLTFICLISVFLPLIGEVFSVFALLLARRYASSQTLLDYDDYVQFNVINLEGVQQQAAESMEMIPIAEAMEMDAAKRKQSIVHLTTTTLADAGKYIQVGLDHTDSETVHYAATVRNTLFDRYEAAVRQKEEQLDPFNVETYYQFIAACETFLESGLLDDGGKKRLNLRLAGGLEQMGVLYSADPEYLHTSGRLALREDDVPRAVRHFSAFIKRYPELPDGYLTLIEYHFTKGDWSEIRPILKQLRTNVPSENIPEEKRFILERLEGGAQ